MDEPKQETDFLEQDENAEQKTPVFSIDDLYRIADVLMNGGLFPVDPILLETYVENKNFNDIEDSEERTLLEYIRNRIDEKKEKGENLEDNNGPDKNLNNHVEQNKDDRRTGEESGANNSKDSMRRQDEQFLNEPGCKITKNNDGSSTYKYKDGTSATLHDKGIQFDDGVVTENKKDWLGRPVYKDSTGKRISEKEAKKRFSANNDRMERHQKGQGINGNKDNSNKKGKKKGKKSLKARMGKAIYRTGKAVSAVGKGMKSFGNIIKKQATSLKKVAESAVKMGQQMISSGIAQCSTVVGCLKGVPSIAVGAASVAFGKTAALAAAACEKIGAAMRKAGINIYKSGKKIQQRGNDIYQNEVGNQVGKIDHQQNISSPQTGHEGSSFENSIEKIFENAANEEQRAEEKGNPNEQKNKEENKEKSDMEKAAALLLLSGRLDLANNAKLQIENRYGKEKAEEIFGKSHVKAPYNPNRPNQSNQNRQTPPKNGGRGSR